MTDRATSGLTLYVSPTCMYCAQVLRAAERLGISLPERDITDPDNRSALVDARGRPTVPVLRIEQDGAHPVWLPESLDIIRELRRRAGRPDPVPVWVDRIVAVSRPIVIGTIVAAVFVPPPWGPPLLGVAVGLVGLELVRRYLAMPRLD